uniref:Neurobeachin a n=2 Tax=Nothobranchius kuhntae TaxID=321403 RepID=A0A1A8HZ71_NOTKU
MSTVDDMIADLLVDMLGVLASYSITVKELKLLFSMLRGENGIWPRHAIKLLSVLNQMPQRHGPDTFFNFPGRSAAAIALPPIAKWPYQNGFTINTWFRQDPLNNINVDKDKPYLYCFRTSKGIGYSAHFVGNCLIVTSLKSKGKGFQHCVKYDFQPRKWYMISIVHIYNRWRNSEIRCYVNGQLVSYGDMAWHVNTNDSYDKCFLGSSETADANRVFCGQLGAIYVFSEALNPAQIFAIHQLGPLCDHILFNAAIWIHTPAKVQLSLYTYLSSEFIGTATIYNTIRRVGTVLQLMHTLKYYYWAINPLECSGISPKGLDGPRPTQKEVISLRAFMLLFLKQLILKDRGVKEDELQSILNYLLTMHEDENIHDVLQLLVALMSEHPASMIPAFDQRNGIRVICKLLASRSESIRVQALKVLGYFLKHLGHKRKVEIMHTHSLFTLLGERLMMHTNTVSITTYNTLYEILTEQVCTQVVHKPHPEPDSTVKIQNPMILKVVATLLKNSSPSAELMEVRRLFLSDMIKLFSNSRENRRCLLQCSVWQDWMFSLGYINPKNPEEQKITEMVTYEAHKEYLAKMYEEYQRQEEENMKKGKKGSVSTISGLSSAPASVVNGNLEIDDNSQTQTPESEAEYSEGAGGDSRNLLAECAVKRPNGEALMPGEPSAGPGVRVEVHDLLVDIKAEKVEATEVKLDDLDLSPEGISGGGGGGSGVGMENGPLVEVDSLLDSAYCSVVQNLNGNLAPKDDATGSGVGIATSLGLSGVSMEDDGNMGPLITLADEKDSVPSNNGFLFSKVDEKLLPALAATDPLVLQSPDQPASSKTIPAHSSASNDLSLLAHMTSCGSDLTQTQSHASEELPEDGPFKIQAPLADISHGQELLIEGLVCMKSSTSVVELVMLLCSQEWQNSIQKNAGLAFIELINEGRLLCHAMKDHIVRVANEAEFILNRQRAEDVHKHAEFESNCAQYAADKKGEEKMCDHLINAAKHRDHVTANQLKQKIVNILTNKHGAWGKPGQSQLHDFWRLDYWEDDLRRRRRFIRNPFGSTHLDVACKSLQEYGLKAGEAVKLKGVVRSPSVASQSPETELILDGDDDNVSLLQEKEMDNLGGPVVLSSSAQLVAPALVARGTLSITTSEIYFEVDEDEPAFKRADSKVLAYTEGLHGKWMFSEIRAVFSRRYLLQNTALEVFMANRTSVMFNFPDQATVKKVVYCLPRVGVGTSYGLPQARQMFVNSNEYELGVRDDGVSVCDVELPAWAKKPEDFVRINRMALESEFVSCQLHQWIDLIFGYKQRGPEAVRALNVFNFLSYEGAINLDNLDALQREPIETQIQVCGQVPSQLLIEPHPPRSSAMHLSPLMFKDQMQQDVIMVLKFPSNSPVTHVAANTLPHLSIPAAVTVTCSRLFAVNRWHNTVGLRGAPGYSLEQAHHLPIEMDPLIANNSGVNKRQITDLVDQSIQINTHCFVVTADNRYILVCGFWDKSFRVYSTETGKLTQIVFGHWDVVTCLARSESYIGGDCYIVSGSRDATLLLWYWSGRHHIIGDNPNNSDYPAPRAVLTGHDHEVVCVSVCAELGLVISGAKEGPCLVHTITGDLLRALEGPELCQQPRLISVSSEGHCIIYYERGRFCNFSINGKLLAQMEVNDSTRAILLSSDGQNLVTGGDNGVVEVWQACDFKQLYIYPGCDAGIRAMDLSHDQRTLITGMASGSIVAFNIDFNRWHYEHQNRY